LGILSSPLGIIGSSALIRASIVDAVRWSLFGIVFLVASSWPTILTQLALAATVAQAVNTAAGLVSVDAQPSRLRKDAALRDVLALVSRGALFVVFWHFFGLTGTS
jgi:hypothetical protein